MENSAELASPLEPYHAARQRFEILEPGSPPLWTAISPVLAYPARFRRFGGIEI
jgi:hypothetical protein